MIKLCASVTALLLLVSFEQLYALNEWGEKGGESSVRVRMVELDARTGQIRYQTDSPGFVRMRLGVLNGPCFNTIINCSYIPEGVHSVGFDNSFLKYVPVESIVFAACCISFDPEIESDINNSIMISNADKFGQVPRYVDLIHCLNIVPHEKAMDGTLELKINDVSIEGDVFVCDGSPFALSIDMISKRAVQFMEERFKLMIYVNSFKIYETWDGAFPASVTIDPKRFGPNDFLLTVNTYTLFDRLAVGSIVVSVNNEQ